MSYKALYRTYRPQTFNEVAGQKVIVQTLENALKQNKIAHAYLFAGPRGTGKTTMAKLFAKALNCEEGVGHQCNKCSNCLGVINGSHPDIFEIDAASNNGVDSVRDLVDNVNYSPIKGRYKVYIIDEVHMMSASAFNALLKTLEEPPAHVIFILATTEPHKILPTILSRCQRYNFTKVSDKDIKERMVDILNEEKITYEEKALDLIISLADGGVRDALSMLDQVLAYANNNLTEQNVLDLFALLSKPEKLSLLNAIKNNDIRTIIASASNFIENGVDINRLTWDLLGFLKDALVYYKTKDATLLLKLNEDEAKDFISDLSLMRLNKMIDILLKTLNDFKFISDIRSLFELSLLQMGATSGTEYVPEPEFKIEKPKTIVNKTESKPVVSKKEETLEETKSQKVEKDDDEDELPPFLQEATSPIEEEKPIIETKEEKEEKPIPISANEIPLINPAELNKEREKNKPIQEAFMEEVKAKREAEEKAKETKKDNVFDFDFDIEPLNREGETFSIERDTLIKGLVLTNHEERIKKTREMMDTLQQWLFFDKISEYANLLYDGKPLIMCDSLLVLTFESPDSVNQCNIINNQQTIRHIFNKLTGKTMIIYAISREEERKLTKHYTDLKQLINLPKVENLDEELKGLW